VPRRLSRFDGFSAVRLWLPCVIGILALYFSTTRLISAISPYRIGMDRAKVEKPGGRVDVLSYCCEVSRK